MPTPAPALFIRLELEAAPVIYLDTLDASEEQRLIDWLLQARPEYGELAARALELAEHDRREAA